MQVTFNAHSPRASVSNGATGSTHATSQQLSLTLRAISETNIVLPNGRDLADHDISFTLFARLANTEKLQAQLPSDGIGILSLMPTRPNEDPFIHGAAIWLEGPLPFFLLQPTIGRTVHMHLPSVPELAEWEEPFSWLPGKQNQLPIESMAIEASFRAAGDA